MLFGELKYTDGKDTFLMRYKYFIYLMAVVTIKLETSNLIDILSFFYIFYILLFNVI